MVHELVQDIQVTLGGIEQQQDLGDDQSFVARAQALDVLQRQILERIENTLYVHGYQEDLAGLYQQAAQLRQRLDAVNVQLFHRLRGEVVAGAATADTLYQLCETYVGHAAPAPAWIDRDEDYLDVFVNGVLGLDQVPEETRVLQSGMIGYVPTPARVIFALLAHLQLSVNDVFYDVGSGIGRVALLVGLLTAAQARGIEVEPAYSAYAQQCAQRLQLHRVTFMSCDAREAAYADGTVFFLYTPFTGRMLQEVLDRLHKATRSRPFTLAAYGLCTAQVAQQSWLQPTVQQTFEQDTLALFSSR